MTEKPTYEELEQRVRELEQAESERKQAQEALLESEQKYRNLFENANEAIFIVQGQKLVFLNPKTTELTGYSAEELRKRPFIDFIYLDDKELVMNRHISRLKGEEISPIYSFRVARKDGSIRWGELNAVLINWNGKIATLNFMNDITERKQAEEALRKSEHWYRTLTETSPDPIIVYDLEGNILTANRQAPRLCGYDSLEEFLDRFRNIGDILIGEDRKRAFDNFEKTLSEGSSRNNEYSIRIGDGSVVRIEVNSSLLRDETGKPVSFISVIRDVTERKQAVEEREKLQALLTQAQKMESIGTLAGGIAHNFNNILMGIQGRTSLMMMDKDPSDPDYENLRGIKEYVKNAVEMTRDLLGFARGGKYEVKPTDLNAFIKHENKMFGRTKKEILIHGKYEKDLWAVELDQGQIQQALLNLYVNAWQAMPGGGDLYVQTENVTLDEEYIKPFEIVPGRYVKISVTDTGVGMDAETREKIFDPFFSTKDIGQGSGLGLASVYGIVKNHGGFINVYSEKGAGATFNIYLPASEKEAAKDGPGPDRHEIQYGQGTVLLVDDEDMIVEVGQKMLEKLHYRVLTAGSGQEALDLYEKQKEEIDLVILDMIMPDMGGGETFDRLKAIDGNVRVLLSSGYSINGQAKEILDRGCSSFIQKPFAMEELSRKVREALDEGKSDAQG